MRGVAVGFEWTRDHRKIDVSFNVHCENLRSWKKARRLVRRVVGGRIGERTSRCGKGVVWVARHDGALASLPRVAECVGEPGFHVGRNLVAIASGVVAGAGLSVTKSAWNSSKTIKKSEVS